MDTLAEKLDYLFETFPKEPGKEYTYKDVEEGTEGAVTATYVWKLRTGKAENPGYKVLQALGEFFGVPMGFFFDEVGTEDVETLKLAAKLRDAGVSRIAMRASDLNPRGKRSVLEMIEYVRKAQGLENGQEGDDQGRQEADAAPAGRD